VHAQEATPDTSKKTKGSWSISAEEPTSETEQALTTSSTQSTSPEEQQLDQELDQQSEASGELEETATDINTQPDLQTQESQSESIASEQQTPNANPEAAKSIDAKPGTNIKTTPVIDLDPQLRDNLERQFQRIREIQENHDAFSEKLGEAYLSYGEALKQAGRLDEAQSMYINALHITKINNGVNSIEQRPMLRALFEMNAALGETEKMEENVKRTIWLEKNYPDVKDSLSFDMVVRLGNHYLDRYLYRPSASEVNLAYLDQAVRYLSYAVNRYGDYPMDELFMPYGELALVHFLRSKIQLEVSRPTFSESRQRRLTEFDRIEPVRTSSNSLGLAQRYLYQYLSKAKVEGLDEDITTALLNLGDINLLFGRKVTAAQYYEEAWSTAQKLPVDHPLVTGFEQPIALPSFKYALDRDDVESYYESVIVPLALNLDASGRVKGFADADAENPYPDLVKRAKRAARRMLFRPVIENGRMIASNANEKGIKVLVRRTSSDRG